MTEKLKQFYKDYEEIKKLQEETGLIHCIRCKKPLKKDKSGYFCECWQNKNMRLLTL